MFLAIAFLAALPGSGPLAGLDLAGPQPPSGTKERAAGSEKLVPAGQLDARLSKFDASQKILTLQLRLPYRNGRAIAYKTVDQDFSTTDDLIIRLATPKEVFDAKGKPRKRTPQELRELRGPGNLWGYKGETDDLRPNQFVRAFFLRPKDAQRAVQPSRQAGAEPTDSQAVINAVYVLQDATK
jgi:hypothetical protein